MTLRRRITVAFGLLALTVAAIYGALTYTLNQRQQWDRLESLLVAELGRTLAVWDEPTLGATLPEQEGGWVLQLVTPGGQVVVPPGGAPRLRAGAVPDVVEYEGRQLLTVAGRLGSGALLHLGLDVGDEIAGARALARQLVWLGIATALLSSLLGSLLATRVLAPFGRLAVAARDVDPNDPQPVPFEGPDDEVAEVARALNAALANIRKRREEERAFLAEIAHELAAPLMLVQGHLDAHSRPDQSEEGRARSLTAAREAARELLLTSQDLLALARGELERPGRMEVIRLSEVLERVRLDYPRLRVAGGPGTVVGDSHRLLQAVRNLVRNAVQAAGTEEGVTVTIQESPDEVVLSVQDAGPGIPPDRLERIFDRYYSGGGGAGVGLAVVNRVVEQHGGQLVVETSPDGSTFTARLPSFAAQITGG